MMPAASTRISTVLVYAIRDDEVLLIKRNKEPNLGQWIAPGGKIELNESPREAAIREMTEETALVIEDLAWRGLCTEVSPLPHWQWMLFIYVTRDFRGELHADLREGALSWIKLDTYLSAARRQAGGHPDPRLPIPQADAIFAPLVLGPGAGMLEAKFTYDVDLRLVEWAIY
jgi:8-oxo-dGTP diphosphatase